MKKMIISMLLIVFIISLQAQKVKFKKGVVKVDGIACLDYDKTPTFVELTTKDGTQTVLLKYIRTGIGSNGGLYTKVIFVEQKKSLTSKSYIFTKKILVKKLIEYKVLVDCKINEDKIDKFILRYDENIEETLIRH